MTIGEARRALQKTFDAADVPDSVLEARFLLQAATGLSHSELITRSDEALSPAAAQRLDEFSARRISGEPVDSILGWREFYGRRFEISGDVLSPRQETEALVSMGLERIKDIATPRILDLGTGSGAIIISLLAERVDALGVCVDVSKAALTIAKKNAAAHEVSPRLVFLHGDWFSPVAILGEDKFELIVSNPPYIDAQAMAELPREVADFDPSVALYGGDDGLAAYRIIVKQAREHMADGASLLLEIGYDQGESVPEILRQHGYVDITVQADLAGHVRIVSGVWRHASIRAQKH